MIEAAVMVPATSNLTQMTPTQAPQVATQTYVQQPTLPPAQIPPGAQQQMLSQAAMSPIHVHLGNQQGAPQNPPIGDQDRDKEREDSKDGPKAQGRDSLGTPRLVETTHEHRHLNVGGVEEKDTLKETLRSIHWKANQDSQNTEVNKGHHQVPINAKTKNMDTRQDNDNRRDNRPTRSGRHGNPKG
ncbi:uncharacterized [Tachysurus ichikawai]